jgi:hypothetical protein
VIVAARPEGGRVPVSTYQGWPSYETWLTYTWLSNDPLLNETCHFLASDASSTYQAADALAAFVEEHLPLNEPGLATDLLRASLHSIAWDRIAQQYREEV